MLVNSVVTSFIAVITLLGFFHQPIHNGFQKWISREAPADTSSEKINLQTLLNELNAVKIHFREQVQQHDNVATTTVQSRTFGDLPRTVDTTTVTTTSQAPSTILNTNTIITTTESQVSKDSLDKVSQLEHELNDLKAAFSAQRKQTQLLQSSTQQHSETIMESQEGDASILENPTSDLKISTSLFSTTPSSTTVNGNDKAEEIADLIAYMENRNKRRLESTSTTLIPLSSTTVQAEPMYTTTQRSTTQPTEEDSSKESYGWNFSIDLNQGYTISVYTVMAGLSLSVMLAVIYFIYKSFKWFTSRFFKAPTCEIAKPDVFSEGKDVFKWLEDFERYANATMSSNALKRGNCLLSFLDDKSRSQLVQYSTMRNNKIEYTTLKEDMQRLFQSKQKSSRQYLHMFISRQQHDDETIPKYYAELCDLVIKAYPTTPPSIREEFVFQQLANGVSNTELRRQLILDYENKSKLRDSLDRYTLMEMSLASQKQSTNAEGTNVSVSITNNTMPINPKDTTIDNKETKRVANIVSTTIEQPLDNQHGADKDDKDEDQKMNETNVQYVQQSNHHHSKRSDSKAVSFAKPNDQAKSKSRESSPISTELRSTLQTLSKQNEELANTLSKQNQNLIKELSRTLATIVPKHELTQVNQPERSSNSSLQTSTCTKAADSNSSSCPRDFNTKMLNSSNSNHKQENRQAQYRHNYNRNAFQIHANGTSSKGFNRKFENGKNKILYSTQDRKSSLSEISGTLKINGLPANFIADTGCNQTVVHERVFRRNGTMNQIKLSPSNVRVTTANGEELTVTGTLNCNIEIGDTMCNTDVLVVPELSKDTLLGMEVLSTNPSTSKLIHALQSEFNDTPVEQINQNLNLNDKIPNNFDEQVNSIQVKSFNSIDECSINTPCSKKQQADTLKIPNLQVRVCRKRTTI